MKKYIIKAIIVIAVFFMSMTVISRVMNKGNTDMRSCISIMVILQIMKVYPVWIWW